MSNAETIVFLADHYYRHGTIILQEPTIDLQNDCRASQQVSFLTERLASEPLGKEVSGLWAQPTSPTPLYQ
ncbi:MAG TPA: hypothetical protein VFB60_25485 [Ktedonobacteraceae bacterium]|nr:hypothetical protein [Ktedonobacteraceae bacterium]